VDNYVESVDNFAHFFSTFSKSFVARALNILNIPIYSLLNFTVSQTGHLPLNAS
jgi:hypothetical protein